ncbi:unnamed protein product, partial [Mesorhabditis belari]|uniref:PH domain-containing protein n=1 Tax=Mesorhabditis belari TaxID=2138241 RepID=A0AAF3FK26_9BILA
MSGRDLVNLTRESFSSVDYRRRMINVPISPKQDSRAIPIIIKKPTMHSTASTPIRTVPIVIQKPSEVKVEASPQYARILPKPRRLQMIDETKKLNNDLSSIEFGKVKEQWESRCRYNEDGTKIESGGSLSSSGKSGQYSLNSDPGEAFKTHPSISKESQVTVIQRSSESAPSLIRQDPLVQFSDMPQLYNIAGTPLKDLRPVVEHKKTPMRKPEEVTISSSASRRRAIPIGLTDESNASPGNYISRRESFIQSDYRSDHSDGNHIVRKASFIQPDRRSEFSHHGSVEMIEVTPYKQETNLLRFPATAAATHSTSTIQSTASRTSKTTCQYEDEIHKMFQFVENEHGDLKEHPLMTSDRGCEYAALTKSGYSSKNQSKFGHDALELTNHEEPQGARLVHSLSGYRRLQQQRENSKTPTSTEPLLLSSAHLTSSPVSRFGNRHESRREQAVPLEIQQTPKTHRKPRFSPAGPTPLPVPIEFRDVHHGTQTRFRDRTPPNPYRSTEVAPSSKPRAWYLPQATSKKSLYDEKPVAESPGDKMRRKITQIAQKFGVGGDKNKKEISKTIPDLHPHVSRVPIRIARDDRPPRPLTPDGDGTVRIRESPASYNVSLRGSRTPNFSRRAGPLATSTPLVKDTPHWLRGVSTISSPWQNGSSAAYRLENLYSPAVTKPDNKLHEDVVVAGGAASNLATNTQMGQRHTSYEPKSEFPRTLQGEPISAIKRIHNKDNEEQTGNTTAKTPPALATSTPRHSLTIAEGQKQRAIIDAWGDTTFLSTITTATTRPGTLNYESKMAMERAIIRLESQADAQLEQVKMSEKVLQLARKKHKMLNELAAARTLLLARERLAAIRLEAQRLENLTKIYPIPPPVANSVRGTMLINNIKVHLGPRFCHQRDDTSTYAFLVLMRCGPEVEATAPITIIDAQRLRVRQLHFAESIRFSNLPLDFSIILEAFTMRMRDAKQDSDPSCISFATKAKLLFSPGMTRRNMLPTPDHGIQPVGEFARSGSVALSRDTVGSQLFYLDGVEYPLEGTIEINTQCTSLPSAVEIDFSGFLTMFQMVGGHGSWVRFWGVLRRGLISFWKDPQDEMDDKSAIAQMDLSKCTDEEIVLAPNVVSMRAHAFSIDMLVARNTTVVEHKRVILAADSRELVDDWLDALNKTLNVIRGRN